jgi:hypothetical protein
VLHPSFPWSILSQIFYCAENVVASSGTKILLVPSTHMRTYVHFYFFQQNYSLALPLIQCIHNLIEIDCESMTSETMWMS